MSRVAYILGAGASYGERIYDKDGNVVRFSRGLPVVNEIAYALKLLQQGGERKGAIFLQEEAKKQNVTLNVYENVRQMLSILERACTSYPTIDTLAKQLFVTGGLFEGLNYGDLKRYLSTALLMMQDEKKRDLRYDGFIAALIDKQRKFPNMTILSWNYDVQFEMAYSGYFTKERYIPSLWKELNVFNKKYPTDFRINDPFAMIKLNGTALFTDSSLEKWSVNGESVNRITDCSSWFNTRRVTESDE